MTPPAATRSVARTAPSRRVGVRHPRRISGPAAPARAATAAAIPAPGIVSPRQRPARPPAKSRRSPASKGARRSSQEAAGIALRAIGAVEGISASTALDRLIRGRAWIGLLAFSLIGIVAMQMVVLELNTRVGRTLARTATLQRENAQLGIEDSMYSAESRVAPLAAAAGMTLAPAGAVHFVQAVPADVSRAASTLSTAIQASASAQAGLTEGANATSGSVEAGGAPVSSEAGDASGSGETGARSGASGAGAASGSAEASEASGSDQASGASGASEAGGGSGSGTSNGAAASTQASSAASGSSASAAGEPANSSGAASAGAATTTAVGGSAAGLSPNAGG
jgi:hypothetical protein